MSGDLTDFLNARINEDQERAEAMGHTAYPPEDEYFWCPAARPGPIGDLEWGEENCDCGVAARKGRALREVEAKRAIVGMHPAEQMRYIAAARCPRCGTSAPCTEMRTIAAIYSDHPAYRSEWAPSMAVAT